MGQLKDGPQVDVGLPGARLHFDGEMRAGPGRVGGHVEQFPGLKRYRRVGNLDVVAGLHRPGIGKQLVGSEHPLVAHPQFRPGLAGEQPTPISHLDDGKLGGSLRLPVEQIRHRGHGVKLVLLVGVELQFHNHPSCDTRQMVVACLAIQRWRSAIRSGFHSVFSAATFWVIWSGH